MIRVIVADDEYKVCQLICQLIDWDGLGMRLVGTTSNGIEALQMIKAEKPDLVLTDIRMPGYDGMELLKRVREINPNMEFIIISGYSQFEYAQTAIRYGVSDYILKPVNKEALNATLQKVRQRYLEHQTQAEENLVQQKQQATDQARLRETLWLDLELEQTPGTLEELNEKYRFHFKDSLFQAFLIQADIKENKDLNVQYANNVMGFLNSKLVGLFAKHLMPLCIDGEIFCRSGRVSGILNYLPEKALSIQSAFEDLSSALCMEMQIFEHMRFHLAIGNADAGVEDLICRIREAERTMGQRLLVRNNTFLNTVPDDVLFNSDELYQSFSIAMRQSFDLQNPEYIDKAVTDLHTQAVKKGLNGNQMLVLVKDAYRLFLLSSIFQNEYHFANKNELETAFNRKMVLCSSHDNLFDYLTFVCKRDMERACSWIEAEKQRPINQAKQYIYEHYAEALSLEDVSSEAGFSSSYFSTLFRKETGKNFLEFLMDVRIEEAKTLLRESKMTIETVGHQVGIHDYKRFAKTFKKVTGISPKEYRNLYS